MDILLTSDDAAHVCSWSAAGDTLCVTSSRATPRTDLHLTTFHTAVRFLWLFIYDASVNATLLDVLTVPTRSWGGISTKGSYFSYEYEYSLIIILHGLLGLTLTLRVAFIHT